MNGVSTLEGSWEPLPGRRMSYRCWMPSKPRALTVIVHGFGEHGGRYAPFAEALAAQGIAVGIPDLWGHGRSSGARGDVGSLPALVDQLAAFTQERLLPESGQQEYVVFGHSFGGLLAGLWALDEPVGLMRVAVQSPLFETGFEIPQWKRQAARVLATCWPSFRLSMELDVAGLTHDAAVVAAYRADPLVHGVMSAGTYVGILRTRDEVVRRTPQNRVPVFLSYGMQDRIVSIPAAQQWFERLTCEKHLVTYPECYHELHHESVKDDVIRHVSAWVLEGRVPDTGVGAR